MCNRVGLLHSPFLTPFVLVLFQYACCIQVISILSYLNIAFSFSLHNASFYKKMNCEIEGVLDMNSINLQEKDTEKILYGVDDIKQASDIIIVIILSMACLSKLSLHTCFLSLFVTLYIYIYI